MSSLVRGVVFAFSPPTRAEVEASQVPVLVPPPIRPQVRRLAADAARRPVALARAVRHHGLRAALATLALRESARCLRLHEVVTFAGVEQPHLSRLLDGPLRTLAVSPRVGALVIAQDEAGRIGGVVANLLAHAERVVVVDGGSTDGTPSLAGDAGAQVLHRTFDNDFAAQRNAGLAAVVAGGAEWCLVLDADEVLGDDLAADLLEVLAVTRAEAVLVPRDTFVDGAVAEWSWPDLQCRAVRSGRRWVGRVHEEVDARSFVVLPLSGPALQHGKTSAELHRGTLRYAEIDPHSTSDEHQAAARAELERLERPEA